MASISAGGSKGHHTYTLNVWEDSYDVNSNTSTVKFNMYLSGSSNYKFSSMNTFRFWIYIDGTEYYYYHPFNRWDGGNEQKLSDQSITIQHSPDGSKTISFSFKVTDTSSASFTTGNAESGTDYLTLTTIPRASTPSLSSQPTSGSQITINTNRASSSFTHTLTYSFGSKSGMIATNVGDSTPWTPPHSLCTEIPSSASGTGTITCTTYSGGTNIGSKNISFTLTAANSLVPSASNIVVSEGNSTIANLNWGLFIQGMSYPSISCTASGIQGSTISKYSLVCYNGNNVVSTIEDTTLSGLNNKLSTQFNKATQYTYKLKVTDSRSRYSEYNVTFTITPYSSPTISSNLNIYRSNSTGIPTTDGTYITVAGSGSITALTNNNVQKNPMTVKIGIKQPSDANYTYTTYYNADTSANTFDFTGQDIKVFANKAITDSYELILVIQDQFKTITRTGSVGTAFAIIDFNENGKAMAIGGYSQAGPNDSRLDILIPTNIDGTINVTGGYYLNGEPFSGGGGGGDSVPIGLISPYPSSTAPNGWLLCDGSAVSRTTYKELFEVIGTTHGQGDGSTTFNLPNIKTRVIAGVDTSDTDFNTIGKTGGSKYLQEHDHSNTVLTRKYQDLAYGVDATFFAGEPSGQGQYNITRWSGNVHGVQTGNSGNLQPYIAEYYMIKAFKVSVPGHDLGDTLPIGSVIDYDGDTVPDGYEQISDYSTSEVFTGKLWIDGKKIYRKVLTGISAGGSSTTLIPVNALVDTYVHIYGFARQAGQSGNYEILPNVNTSDSNYNIGLRAFNNNASSSNKNNIRITTGSMAGFDNLHITIEYTKTTD